MNPLISVIIPVYNREKLIEAAINSVLSQTYQNFEIIIIDDGSKDNTRAIIEQLNNPKIKYIYQENAGPSAARNNGIKQAQGEYIAFLDSDDIWLPQKLEKQIAIINQNPKLGIISCWSLYLNEDGKKLSNKTCYAKNSLEFTSGILLTPHRVISATATMVIKKECFEEIGYFDEEMIALEDWDLWFRVALKYEFACINEVLVLINVHEGLSKTTEIIKFKNNYLRFLKKIYDRRDLPDYITKIKNKVYSNAHYYIGWWSLCQYKNNTIARTDLLESLKYSYLKLFNPEFLIVFILSYSPIQLVDVYDKLRKLARKLITIINTVKLPG